MERRIARSDDHEVSPTHGRNPAFEKTLATFIAETPVYAALHNTIPTGCKGCKGLELYTFAKDVELSPHRYRSVILQHCNERSLVTPTLDLVDYIACGYCNPSGILLF